MRRTNFSRILRYKRITESRSDDQTQVIVNNNNNIRTCRIVDIAVIVDHRVKLKKVKIGINICTLQKS